MADFTLTTTADDITGTAGNDVFRGPAGTLQSYDVIDGGAGRDILVADAAQNGVQDPTISNIEFIYVDSGGQPFSIANITGAERLFADRASLIVEDVAQEDLAIRYGAQLVESGTVDLRFDDGALEGTDDELRLAAFNSNVTFTSGSTFDSPGGPENQTEDALRIESISLVSYGEENQVDISDFSMTETLIMTGDAATTISVDSPALTQFFALRTTGGVTIENDTDTDQDFTGGSGDDELTTGSGDDRIRGNDGDDVILAGGGDNVVNAGTGDDEVTTEQGADIIVGGAGNDVISSGSGDDRVSGGTGNDEITAGDGADIIAGQDGDDMIMGQGGADQIYDGNGNDTADGGSDNDIFVAGAGNDTFTGGGGVDTFRFLGTTDRDEVTDFTLTTTAATNDIVEFSVGGAMQMLQSQGDFQDFVDQNGMLVTVDDATSTITIDADSGTIVLQVSDTDFLMV